MKVSFDTYFTVNIFLNYITFRDLLIFFYCYSADGGENGERKKTKMPGREDDNIVGMLTNATNNVVGKVGDMVGKSIGGISTKFGSGSWF